MVPTTLFASLVVMPLSKFSLIIEGLKMAFKGGGNEMLEVKNQLVELAKRVVGTTITKAAGCIKKRMLAPFRIAPTRRATSPPTIPTTVRISIAIIIIVPCGLIFKP